jgi:hypothetical protein
MITRLGRLDQEVPRPDQKISHTVVSLRSASSKIYNFVVAVKLPGRPQKNNIEIKVEWATRTN